MGKRCKTNLNLIWFARFVFSFRNLFLLATIFSSSCFFLFFSCSFEPFQSVLIESAFTLKSTAHLIPNSFQPNQSRAPNSERGTHSGFLSFSIYMSVLRWTKWHLPSGETTVFDVEFRICRELTDHFISAGGFDGAVAHVSGTVSPIRASDGPDIETWVGATEIRLIVRMRTIHVWFMDIAGIGETRTKYKWKITQNS